MQLSRCDAHATKSLRVTTIPIKYRIPARILYVIRLFDGNLMMIDNNSAQRTRT